MTEDEQEFLEGALLHVMHGVREYGEGRPVQLRRDMKTGRVFVSAFNEGGNNVTAVDLFDLLDWLQSGPVSGRVEGGFVLPQKTSQ